VLGIFGAIAVAGGICLPSMPKPSFLENPQELLGLLELPVSGFGNSRHDLPGHT
jgi:hypothetical protein